MCDKRESGNLDVNRETRQLYRECYQRVLISCAISAADLRESPSDLVVLPEGVEIAEIHEAAARCPASCEVRQRA